MFLSSGNRTEMISAISRPVYGQEGSREDWGICPSGAGIVWPRAFVRADRREDMKVHIRSSLPSRRLPSALFRRAWDHKASTTTCTREFYSDLLLYPFTRHTMHRDISLYASVRCSIYLFHSAPLVSSFLIRCLDDRFEKCVNCSLTSVKLTSVNSPIFA